MKKKILILSFFTFIHYFINAQTKEDLVKDNNHIKLEIQLRVSSPEVKRKEILKFLEEKKGYLKSLNNEEMYMIFFKSEKKEDLIQSFKKYGSILSYNFTTIDYGEEIINLKSKIQVKEKYLKDLNQLTKEANFIQTLEMEKEISKVIEELEEYKARYQYLIELSNTIEVRILFESLSKNNLPVSIIPGWISKIGIFTFVERFDEK